MILMPHQTKQAYRKQKMLLFQENLSWKKEIMTLKKKVKESRRLKHERNKEQQMKKVGGFLDLDLLLHILWSRQDCNQLI